MLHHTVLHTGEALRDNLAKGIEKLEAGGQAAQARTEKAVTAELERMRTDLRDARNRLTTNRDELSEEVRGALTFLRQESGGVRAALQDLQLKLAEVRPADARPTDEGAAPAAGTVAAPGQRAEHAPAPEVRPTASMAETGQTAPAQGEFEPSLRTEQVRLPAQRVSSEPVGEEPSAPEADGRFAALLLDGLREELRPLHEQVASLRDDLEGLRTAAEAQQRDAVAARTAGEAQEPPVSEEHGALLARASRISSVALVCHRDLWEFVAGQAGGHPHFRMPARIADNGDDRVSAPLSGRSLIAVLSVLHTTRHTSAQQGADWALAGTVYERIAEGLAVLDTEGCQVTITLDDRSPNPSSSGPPRIDTGA